MNRIRVSACIVTYNNKDEVLTAVESILQQTKGVDLTLYISDNGSTDDTVESMKTRFPSVIVIEGGENKGFGHGHNRVLPFLASDVHFVINPDIILYEDAITALSRYLMANREVGLAVPKVLNADGTEQFLPKKNPRFLYLLGGRIGFLSKYRDEYTMKDHVFTQPTPIEFCTGCFMAIPTDVFRQVGGFDPRYFMYFEDADLTRTVGQTYRTVLCPQVTVTHVWERAGAKKIKYFLIQVNSMFKYFFKWVGK